MLSLGLLMMAGDLDQADARRAETDADLLLVASQFFCVRLLFVYLRTFHNLVVLTT